MLYYSIKDQNERDIDRLNFNYNNRYEGFQVSPQGVKNKKMQYNMHI